jgi:hypothetical protein
MSFLRPEPAAEAVVTAVELTSLADRFDSQSLDLTLRPQSSSDSDDDVMVDGDGAVPRTSREARSSSALNVTPVGSLTFAPTEYVGVVCQEPPGRATPRSPPGFGHAVDGNLEHKTADNLVRHTDQPKAAHKLGKSCLQPAEQFRLRHELHFAVPAVTFDRQRQRVARSVSRTNASGANTICAV